MNNFLSVAEAVKLTGKSRRTITRLANRLEHAGSDQVMNEKTARGYMWRLSPKSLQDAFAATKSQTFSAIETGSTPAPPPVHINPAHALDIARQGYTGMMTMHQEVKQAYDALLEEKDQRITALNQALAQARKGLWARLFNR